MSLGVLWLRECQLLYIVHLPGGNSRFAMYGAMLVHSYSKIVWNRVRVAPDVACFEVYLTYTNLLDQVLVVLGIAPVSLVGCGVAGAASPSNVSLS